jgi:integrase
MMANPQRRATAEPYWNERKARFEVFVELPPGPDGKRRRKQITGPTATAVRTKANKVRAEILTTGTTTNDAVTVARVMAEYLEAVVPNVRPRTLEQYQGWSDRYVVPLLGTKKVSTLTPAEVRTFHQRMRDLGYSTNTIRMAHRVLRQALGHAEREGYVIRNVAKVQGGPRDGGDTRKVEPLTPAEATKVLEAVEGWRYEALVYLLLGCGLRVGEALGLQWGNVDLDAGELRVIAQVSELRGTGKTWVDFPKTASSRRTVAIPDIVVSKLRAHRRLMIEERMALGHGAPGADDVVIPNEYHGLGDRSNIARMLKERCANAGVTDVHPHKLRHTYVSLALDRGVPLEAVSDTVGHANLATTKDIYGRMQERARRNVADAVGATLAGSA